MRRLIWFLIRRLLHVNLFEPFQFKNQKCKLDFYYFGHAGLWKYSSALGQYTKAHVSLNWILDKECEIGEPWFE